VGDGTGLGAGDGTELGVGAGDGVPGVGVAVGLGPRDGLADAPGEADGLGDAEGDGTGSGSETTLPILGSEPPPLLVNGVWSLGEFTTSAATAAALAALNAKAVPTIAARRTGGRSPVFCGDAFQACRSGVRLMPSAARLAVGDEP
jgi:hypothetical protein